MKIIDFRIRPPYRSIKESLLYSRKPRSEENWGLNTAPSVLNESMEMLLHEMDQANITKAVVPLRRAFNMQNDDLVLLSNEYPNRFIGCPCLDPSNVNISLNEIEQYIISGIFNMIMMEPGKCSPPMKSDDKSIYPIYDICQKNNVPVLLSHGGFIPPDKKYNDTSSIHRIAEDFPNLKLVVCHAAWPYINEIIFEVKTHKNVYLVPDMYMVNSPGDNDYITAANYLLQDKMIFASAYPLLPLEETINFLKKKLRNEVWEKFFYSNAAKVLNLD